MTKRPVRKAMMCAFLIGLSALTILPSGGAHHTIERHDLYDWEIRFQHGFHCDGLRQQSTEPFSGIVTKKCTPWNKVMGAASMSPAFTGAWARTTTDSGVPSGYFYNGVNSIGDSRSYLSYSGPVSVKWSVTCSNGVVKLPGFTGCSNGIIERSGPMPALEARADVSVAVGWEGNEVQSGSATVRLVSVQALPGPGAPDCVDSLNSKELVCGKAARYVIGGVEGEAPRAPLPRHDPFGEPIDRSMEGAAFSHGLGVAQSGEPACASIGVVDLEQDGGNISFTPSNVDFEGTCTVEIHEHIGDETTNETVRFHLEAVNDVPVPIASAPVSVLIGQTLILDGSSSFDVDGPSDIASYVWDQGEGTQVHGSTQTLGLDTSELPIGHRAFRLTVTDHAGASAETWTDPVYVHVPPVAVTRLAAGGVDGAQSFEPDPESDAIVAYDWSFGGDQPFLPLAYPDGRDRCGTLTVTDRYGAQGTTGICLAEAEARTKAVLVDAPRVRLESQGTGLDALGSESTEDQVFSEGGVTVRSIHEESAVLRQGANVVSSADVTLARIDIPQALLTIEGVALEADARWNVETGASQHSVKRAVAKVVIGGVGVHYIGEADGPVEIPLPGGGIVSLFARQVEETEHGVTYREDAVRVTLPGTTTMVFGSVLVQAGDHTMEAPAPFEA